MSSMLKRDYDIPVNFWVSVDSNERHNLPRIKVQQDKGSRINYNNFCSVSISKTPKVLSGNWILNSNDTARVFHIIANNVGLFLKMWNSEIEMKEMMSELDFS